MILVEKFIYFYTCDYGLQVNIQRFSKNEASTIFIE